ncbi:phage replisome organizer N-terminal domain-containing protein [Fusobacterium necrophorum]|nr:phage replisome organizer N-terminal domain-containing protein [Fusobacterium necrophorum]MDY2572637.1 phage replisome organizer N-terminal domain-containing protein [Fusobacterium necrophorum]
MIATITRHQVGTVERAIKIFLELELIDQLPDNILYMADIELFIRKLSTEGEKKATF